MGGANAALAELLVDEIGNRFQPATPTFLILAEAAHGEP